MFLISTTYERLRAWYHGAQMEITLGAVFAIACIGWNVRTNFDADVHLHAMDCESARARFIDVETFWQGKATTQAKNSRDKYDARDLWTSISGELGKAQSPSLARDIVRVAAKWQSQGDNDNDDAALDRTYVASLQRDFTKSCGSPPTPMPTMVPAPSPTPTHRRYSSFTSFTQSLAIAGLFLLEIRMIHARFDRPNAKYKVFGPDGALATDAFGELVFEAAGDAWGGPGYGHNGWCPPGHFLLTSIEEFDRIASEGSAQIDVSDMDEATLARLVASHHAAEHGSAGVDIGGIVAKVGQLAAYGRGGIMNHGGGSNAPDPYAPFQQLCKTEGCTRHHNASLARLVAYLKPLMDSNTVVYTIIGDPLPLAC